VRKNRTPGSVRGVPGNRHPYRDGEESPRCWELLPTEERMLHSRMAWYVTLVVLLASSALVVLLASKEQRTSGAGVTKRSQPFRIGALTDSWGPTPQMVGLRDGLLALGYHEHKQFAIGVRFTQGDIAALPAAAREMVQYGVDLIFASDEIPTKAAQQATSQLPIVFAGGVDPMGQGLVQSFAQPGGNITGVTDLVLDLGPKRLQVFQEMMPGLQRILYVYDASDAAAVAEARIYRDAARRLGIALVEQAVQTQEEAQAILAQVRKDEVDGLLQPRSVSLNIPGFILEATVQRGIPAMFDSVFWVERGGLASYGSDVYETGRQAARLVDKILWGTKPAVIPAEVNPQIEFVINLKTADALGVTITPEVLSQANRLIR
jgi:putative ABC transport system substrate-binding protein